MYSRAHNSVMYGWLGVLGLWPLMLLMMVSFMFLVLFVHKSAPLIFSIPLYNIYNKVMSKCTTRAHWVYVCFQKFTFIFPAYCMHILAFCSECEIEEILNLAYFEIWMSRNRSLSIDLASAQEADNSAIPFINNEMTNNWISKDFRSYTK